MIKICLKRLENTSEGYDVETSCSEGTKTVAVDNIGSFDKLVGGEGVNSVF